jgi:hypothetical protein
MYKVILLNEETDQVNETRCETFIEYINLLMCLDNKYTLLATELIDVELREPKEFFKPNNPDLVEGKNE